MKERVRCLLGALAPAAVVVLLMVLFLLSSSYSLNKGKKSLICGGARKLLSVKAALNPSSSLSSQNQMRVDSSRAKNPEKQARVSFRRIPPSASNPTQNKSGPQIDRPGKV